MTPVACQPSRVAMLTVHGLDPPSHTAREQQWTDPYPYSSVPTPHPTFAPSVQGGHPARVGTIYRSSCPWAHFRKLRLGEVRRKPSSTATIKSIEPAAFMDQAAIDYVLAA